MARTVFLSVAATAVIGVGLLSASIAAASGTPTGLPPVPTTSSPSPINTAPVQPSVPIGFAEQQIAERQAQTLTGQLLIEQQAATKAYLAVVAGDPGTIVCLTSQGVLGLVISVDRPAGAEPFTTKEKQQSCAAHLAGSHAAP